MELIDPKGDVILVVGETKLRVSSKVLSLASEPFAGMFGPHFKEGQDLSPEHPKEIPLPEDDPAPMRFVCEVLHHRLNVSQLVEKSHLASFQQFSDLKKTPGAVKQATDYLVNVALLANKYMMLKPLSISIQKLCEPLIKWIKDIVRNVNAIGSSELSIMRKTMPECLFDLLASAYQIEDKAVFLKTSGWLISLQPAESFLTLRNCKGASLVPECIFLYLEESKNYFRSKIGTTLRRVSYHNQDAISTSIEDWDHVRRMVHPHCGKDKMQARFGRESFFTCIWISEEYQLIVEGLMRALELDLDYYQEVTLWKSNRPDSERMDMMKVVSDAVQKFRTDSLGLAEGRCDLVP